MSDDGTLPCVRCGAALCSALPPDVRERTSNQPADGLAFSSSGHYGTTVFDPTDGSTIEVNLCDACLRLAIERGHARVKK